MKQLLLYEGDKDVWSVRVKENIIFVMLCIFKAKLKCYNRCHNSTHSLNK